MDILNFDKSFSVKVLLMIRLLSSTIIGCLTLSLKEVVVIDILFLLALGVVRNMMASIWPVQSVVLSVERVVTR